MHRLGDILTTRNQFKSEIFRLQCWVNSEKLAGKTIDEIIYSSSEFEEFEELLNEEEYSILLLTILNNFKSEHIINTILDAIENKLSKKNV
ncbi:MAG: hypothetical protein CMF96_00770 [Candidatus Marinimicrobia bacterium]|nr:hypothetical protein [Candidatus Neomarinimicrobiota bacterium]|tara:strand:- start:2294 stop:2566 length:273 start_codon:yes stop_codon:yes gene_type:complete